MELGASVLENISLAGDVAHIPDKLFEKFVICACQGVLFEKHRDVVAGMGQVTLTGVWK